MGLLITTERMGHHNESLPITDVREERRMFRRRSNATCASVCSVNTRYLWVLACERLCENPAV